MGKASRSKGSRPKKPITKCLRCGGRVDWPGRKAERSSLRKLTVNPASWCQACSREARKLRGTAVYDDDNFYDRLIKDLETFGDEEEGNG